MTRMPPRRLSRRRKVVVGRQLVGRDDKVVITRKDVALQTHRASPPSPVGPTREGQ